MISPDAEAVFYGCLDFRAKPVFGIMLIVGHWKIDPARMGLQFRDYVEPVVQGKSEESGSSRGGPLTEAMSTRVDPR